MATISFNKNFAITKKETVERLEKGAQSVKPLMVDSKYVVANMKRSEGKLLSMLRSKA